jgi:hypothetical protein
MCNSPALVKKEESLSGWYFECVHCLTTIGITATHLKAGFTNKGYTKYATVVFSGKWDCAKSATRAINAYSVNARKQTLDQGKTI